MQDEPPGVWRLQVVSVASTVVVLVSTVAVLLHSTESAGATADWLHVLRAELCLLV